MLLTLRTGYKRCGELFSCTFTPIVSISPFLSLLINQPLSPSGFRSIFPL